MSLTPYTVLVQWWPVFLDVFLACLAAHLVFFFYLYLVREIKQWWNNKRHKAVKIRIIPGISSVINKNVN